MIKIGKPFNKLNDLPLETLPRERLLKYGAYVLADYELLAIILRTGTKDIPVIDLSKNLLCSLHSLNALNDVTIEELKSIKGIKEAKAIEILAAIELGKRVFSSKRTCGRVNSSLELYEYLRGEMENLTYEETRCAYLNGKGGIIEIKKLGTGNADSTFADYREIVKWALKLSSYYIILVHNHPSGSCEPSYNDRKFTSELKAFSSKMGISLIDHIIIGKNKYYSFNEDKKI